MQSQLLPANARRWLLDEGSLTAQLQAASGNRLRVRVLSQQWRRPRAGGAPRARRSRTHEVALVREVLLECAGEPWVFARSVTACGHADWTPAPPASLRRTLARARLLFATRGLRREPFELALCAQRRTASCQRRRPTAEPQSGGGARCFGCGGSNHCWLPSSSCRHAGSRSL
jgi:chorismate-pyruvate lyase